MRSAVRTESHTANHKRDNATRRFIIFWITCMWMFLSVPDAAAATIRHTHLRTHRLLRGKNTASLPDETVRTSFTPIGFQALSPGLRWERVLLVRGAWFSLLGLRECVALWEKKSLGLMNGARSGKQAQGARRRCTRSMRHRRRNRWPGIDNHWHAHWSNHVLRSHCEVEKKKSTCGYGQLHVLTPWLSAARERSVWCSQQIPHRREAYIQGIWFSLVWIRQIFFSSCI